MCFPRTGDGKRQEVLKKALHLFGKGEEGVEEEVKTFENGIDFEYFFLFLCFIP